MRKKPEIYKVIVKPDYSSFELIILAAFIVIPLACLFLINVMIFFNRLEQPKEFWKVSKLVGKTSPIPAIHQLQTIANQKDTEKHVRILAQLGLVQIWREENKKDEKLKNAYGRRFPDKAALVEQKIRQGNEKIQKSLKQAETLSQSYRNNGCSEALKKAQEPQEWGEMMEISKQCQEIKEKKPMINIPFFKSIKIPFFN